MFTVRDLALRGESVDLLTFGGVIFDRFDADADMLAIAVLDAAGVPIGLVERNNFMLKIGSVYGRSLYAGRPISLLMDADPLIVDAATPVSKFTEAALADRPSGLLRGFIAVSEGRFVGVGSTLALFQALSAESRERNAQLVQAGDTLRSAERKAQAAHLLLTQALDAMSEGVAIFDAQDRCVLWNSRYAQLHAESADILKSGVTFEALLRHGVARGQYPKAIGREVSWSEERLRRRAGLSDRTSEEQDLPNGRCIRLEETRLKTGGCISVAVDITDIRRREASFRLLFESNPVPLAVFDRETLGMLAANEAALSQYGYNAGNLEALHADRVLAPEERRPARRARLGVGDHMYAGEKSWTFLTSRGERKQVLPYMHPLTYEGRAATLVAAVDISQQHEVETALKDAVERAEAADRAKSEFLANMSHELRTPLNGVVGMASVLARTGLDEPQRDMVQVIQTSGATLQALLSDVLDLAKIEAQRIDLQLDPVTPATLARHVATLFSAPSAEKGLRFELDIDAESAKPVLSDGVRLCQILTNLCSNAVKFTERGAVKLTARTVTAGERRAVRFTVTDSGIGLSPEACSRIFERFSQADGSITRRFGGTGLGLSICEQLTRILGGRIAVQSVEGVGSTFTVDFDFQAAEAPTLAPVESAGAARASAQLDRPRVLLVEDHPVNRKVIQLMIGDLVDLSVAENGVEGVEAFCAADFDVVLMDMQMPVLDGVSATRQIRAREARLRLPRTPIVMLTANALPEHIRTSHDAGADAHVAKPVTAEALFATLEQVLSGVSEPDQRLSA